jgi:endo-1,4-beta-D-glucanase Y
MPGDPTPASGGAAFPFPQHRLSRYCYYPPACNDADVSTVWNMYKSTFIVPAGNGMRVQRPESGGDTVSEGLGYGMIAAVYMNDKPTFDGLWAYTNQRLDANGLMYWHQTAAGARATDAGGGATDADEDIAFALVMADKQWGGYTTPAKAMVAAILAHEVEGGSNVLKPGDNFGGSSQLDPSYIAPAYYRVFASYSGNNQWMSVLAANNAVLSKCANASTGLVPDWCNASGQAQPGPGGGSITAFGNDAARTPFRVALDACWTNDPDAMALAGKEAAFFDGIGMANLKDGYTLTGSVTGSTSQLFFQGPAAVAGMAGNKTQLVIDGYTRITRVVTNGGVTNNYFSASWAVLSELVMTGNFVNFTAP